MIHTTYFTLNTLVINEDRITSNFSVKNGFHNKSSWMIDIMIVGRTTIIRRRNKNSCEQFSY
jgi:hypothetical protein